MASTTDSGRRSLSSISDPIAPYPLLNSTWAEYGGRLAYRFSRNLVVDAFAIGTLGGEVGRTLHVGLGARYAF